MVDRQYAMNRRDMICQTAAAALGLSFGLRPRSRAAEAGGVSAKKVLFFTKSSGFEHSVIKRGADGSSFAGRILDDIGPAHGLAFTHSKDGSLFAPDYLAQFDAFFFYTSGNLCGRGGDQNPPMTEAGKQALLDAVRGGKGFAGCHSASDTFHTNEGPEHDYRDKSLRYRNHGPEADPYIKMLGGEFIRHGPQQSARMRVVDPEFPGFGALGAGFDLHEEWYSLKEFASDLHVLLVQETAGMKGPEYQRAPYPSTWARWHGRGRVFYTAMGHREDVWTNPIFQGILLGGLGWASGQFDADVAPNLEETAPAHAEIPPAE